MNVGKLILGGVSAILVAANAANAPSVNAAEFNLTISSWAPPKHGLNAQMWPSLIKMMEEATGGRVTAEVKYGIAPPPAQMDLVIDGAADMSVIFHGYQAGRFTATKLIELPGYDGNAEAASVAYWRVHQKYLAKAKEHRGVKLIGLHTHGPAQLHSNVKVTSLSEIKGMKIRVPGGVGSEVGNALGATGIKVPAPKVYETLASRTADGVVMPLETRGGFKLTEVAKNVYVIPGGLYRGSFAFIMNEEVFDSLPADVRQALEEKVFGEPASRMAGAIWDANDDKARKLTNDTAGNSINSASDADIATYKPIAEKIVGSVLAEITAKGIDAAAAHRMVQTEMSAN
ncbi:TRAP transporter substrate-binding protein [Pelagibius sp. Alg239-R121]|uniref:TRAP transporter substrate-binding protein n=1 Tax=Pelagibius sp. Alg239-R121 TaxID=2993448 RepID=UPI0024A6EE37|nr:TRAP transporter substrate-binding protein [Pelagibius sp. Alg239-R121]